MHPERQPSASRQESREPKAMSEVWRPGEALRAILDYTSDGILFADPQNRYLDANASACRMLGYSRDDLIGRTAADIVAPAELKLIAPALDEISATGEHRREWQLRRKDNSPFAASVTSIRLLDGNRLVFLRDLTVRIQSEADLHAAEQKLRALVGRLHTVREEEARRISRELHDDLGQQLTAFNMELADMKAKLPGLTPKQCEHFSRMHAGVDHMIGVVQQISGDLRLAQLDVLGLSAAIDWQAKEFSRRSLIPCRIVRLDEVSQLTDAQTTAAFRILQESLTNIGRHSGATEVKIFLEIRPDQAELRIHDNGRGITDTELNDDKSIGLIGMRERARLVGGVLAITGGFGVGTTVTLRMVPRRSGTALS